MKLNAKEIFETLTSVKFFPLQTIQSMSERWGVSRQAVTNWATRHSDFPAQITGIIEATAKTPAVYALYEVELYEVAHKLVKKNDDGELSK